jgi:hypothetical protein
MALDSPPVSCPSDSESADSEFGATSCHSDRSRSASDGAVEEPAVGPYPESSRVRQHSAEVRSSMTRSALGLGAMALGGLLLRQLLRKRE